MKYSASILFPFLILASCSAPKKTITSIEQNANSSSNVSNSVGILKQDGLSFKTAVFVTEKTEKTGPSSEYKWIKEHYTDYKVKMQALVYSEQKPFDIITIIFSDGKEIKLYFDISNYFGKF